MRGAFGYAYGEPDSATDGGPERVTYVCADGRAYFGADREPVPRAYAATDYPSDADADDAQDLLLQLHGGGAHGGSHHGDAADKDAQPDAAADRATATNAGPGGRTAAVARADVGAHVHDHDLDDDDQDDDDQDVAADA